MTTAPATIDPEKLEATVEQVFGYLGGAVISGMIFLGDHLGLYRALADAAEPLTSDGLATRTGLHERWVREWLRGQAAARLVDYDGAGKRREQAQQMRAMNEPSRRILITRDGVKEQYDLTAALLWLAT